MTVERQHIVHCDYGGCRDWIRMQYATLAEARKQARKKGWRTRKVMTLGGTNVTKDYCPRHKP